MIKLIPILCAGVVIALPLAANAQDRQEPPPGGTPKDFNLPEKFSFGLDNGMRATLVPGLRGCRYWMPPYTSGAS